VAAVARPVVCQQRRNEMTHKPNNNAPVPGQRGRLPPVRVRLERPDAYKQQTCSPDGANEHWWARLDKALGTVSPDFVKSSLLQLQAAARSG
jgi:hypothetical protein